MNAAAAAAEAPLLKVGRARSRSTSSDEGPPSVRKYPRHHHHHHDHTETKPAPNRPPPDAEGTGAASKFLVLARIGNHLANERTLLAWVRTSLAMVGLGAGLARFDEVTGGIGAVVFVTAGLFCLIVGTQRYYKVKNALLRFDKREYDITFIALVRMGIKPVVVVCGLLTCMLVVWFAYKLAEFCLDHY
eukprot:TRINITY_DN10822_c0_g1_i1.p1 TRINITY_DN10822_c0_g1~~TRINITY_DN10822_c0_g1_i1.p1  ORF type:complete len:189 (-),score=23.77 TRINITY_DN10822_c0_g1_i1:45-611(-)